MAGGKNLEQQVLDLFIQSNAMSSLYVLSFFGCGRSEETADLP